MAAPEGFTTLLFIAAGRAEAVYGPCDLPIPFSEIRWVPLVLSGQSDHIIGKKPDLPAVQGDGSIIPLR